MGGCACSHSARNRLYSYACPANVDAHWGDIEIPDGGELAVAAQLALHSTNVELLDQSVLDLKNVPDHMLH